jgi:protein O-GlcNAc transferase
MVVDSLEEYEARAIRYAKSLSYDTIKDSSGEIRRRGKGELMELRRSLYLSREDMPLFDTLRWTRNLEKGLAEAWRRWIAGTCFGNVHKIVDKSHLTRCC